MEFLVRITVNVPTHVTPDEEQRLRAAELVAGRKLADDGIIQRIWRVPGTTSNVGIWRVADADELHRVLTSLPMYAWLGVDVQALSLHPIEDPGV